MKLNEEKKEIIEFFLKHPTEDNGIFEITQNQFDKHFNNKSVYNINLQTLIANNVISKATKNGEKILRLFKRDHQIEVRKIINYKSLEDLAQKMQPTHDMTENLIPRFYEHADQNKSNGVYYFYTKQDDPDYWVVFARLNPKKDAYKYTLGSIKDSESRLHKMWLATVQAWKDNRKEPIRRGAAEKLDQDSFGNNRQRGFASFKLFSHAGWLRIPYGTGTSIYYDVVDDKAHRDQTKLDQFTSNILKRWGFEDNN
ncbi:MAG: hypothetical protein WD154_00980 [Nitrosopumilaceae archaeon]